MAHYKLTYFNVRGRGEIVRLVFAAAGVSYEDNRIDGPQWTELKPNMPFGQVPVLEFDGHIICQSNAIARYLSRKFKLAGKTELEEVYVDMLVECLEDVLKLVSVYILEKDETRKEALLTKLRDEQLPTSFAHLEKLLKSNKGGDGYFVGDGITLADLAFINVTAWIKMIGTEILLNNYPKLKALKERVETLPRLAEWIAKRPVTDI